MTARDPPERSPRSDMPAPFRPVVLLAVAAYALATALTRSLFTGDAPDYADSIVARLRGADYGFWDAGHLLWRPIGYVVFRAVLPLTGSTAASPGAVAGAETTLAWLAWLAGLACVVLLALWLGRLGAPRVATAVTVLLFIVSHAFLDYARAGSAYVPGLAFLLLGAYLLSGARGDPSRPPRAGVGAGLALAGALLVWLPYVLALPAVLLSPVLLFGASRARWRLVAVATAACGIASAVAYGAVAAHVGVTTPTAFVDWFWQASHGIAGTGGVSRAVFGYARSFLNMGNDGALVKRFLLHDPYNPVTPADLLRLSLWKVALFYAFVGAVVVGAWRTATGRRALLLTAVAAVPTFVFALAWQAGDLERYLPMLAPFCVAVAAALGGWWSPRDDAPPMDATWPGASPTPLPPLPLLSRAVRAVVVLFVVVAAAVNLYALSATRASRDDARVAARVGALATDRLPPHSVLVVANWHDDLVSYWRANPGRGINARARLPLYVLVTSGSESAPRWRSEFADRALEAWRAGGEVWLSRRALAPRPAPTWNWVEGDDPRVSWADFAPFFTTLDLGPSRVGGPDGFVLVPETEANVGRLRGILSASP